MSDRIIYCCYDENSVNLIKPKSNPMKNINGVIGIIDEVKNPFSRNRQSWIEQGYGLTKHRKAQLLPLLNMQTKQILDYRPENEAKYVAFIAIRWGFAILSNEKLVGTQKLDDYVFYTPHGNRK